MLDCAPLDRYRTETEAALAFSRRTGNEHLEQVFDSYQWLAGALLGESTAEAGAGVSPEKYAGNPHAQFFALLNQANAAAIFGDRAGSPDPARSPPTMWPPRPSPTPPSTRTPRPWIRIEQAGDTLTVEVRDDGDDGDGGADASRGSGLTGLRDRVEAVGGSMRLDDH